MPLSSASAEMILPGHNSEGEDNIKPGERPLACDSPRDPRDPTLDSLALLQGSFGPFGPKVANRVRK